MLTSFFTGLVRANRSWRMILLLLVANILVSIPIAVPIFWLIAQTSSERLAAGAMLADKLDLNWMTDLVNLRLPGESVESVGGLIGLTMVVMGLFYLLLNALFAGGILEVFASREDGFTMHRFWAGCGAYFWRFFRLMLISLLFYGAVYVVYFLIRLPIDASVKQAAAYGPIFYKRWAAAVVLVLMFAFVNMIFDYAKISTVVGDRRGMFREVISATGFAVRNFFRAYSLYWLVGLIGLGLFALFAWLRASVNQGSIIAVFIAILLGQLAMAARMWTRLVFYAAELDLYWRLTPLPMAEIEFAVAEVGKPIFLLPTEEVQEHPVTDSPAESN